MQIEMIVNRDYPLGCPLSSVVSRALHNKPLQSEIFLCLIMVQSFVGWCVTTVQGLTPISLSSCQRPERGLSNLDCVMCGTICYKVYSPSDYIQE